MIVISDATPLRYLILIGQEQLLPKMFGRVSLPTSVFRELQADRTPETVKAWMANRPKWLEVRQITTDPGPAPSSLGEGEWHAIILAQEMKAELLLIDDRECRREAKRRAIPVTGTLGILDKAAELGLIDLQVVMEQLGKTNFYLSADAMKSLLDRHSGHRSKS